VAAILDLRLASQTLVWYESTIVYFMHDLDFKCMKWFLSRICLYVILIHVKLCSVVATILDIRYITIKLGIIPPHHHLCKI